MADSWSLRQIGISRVTCRSTSLGCLTRLLTTPFLTARSSRWPPQLASEPQRHHDVRSKFESLSSKRLIEKCCRHRLLISLVQGYARRLHYMDRRFGEWGRATLYTLYTLYTLHTQGKRGNPPAKREKRKRVVLPFGLEFHEATNHTA